MWLKRMPVTVNLHDVFHCMEGVFIAGYVYVLWPSRPALSCPTSTCAEWLYVIHTSPRHVSHSDAFECQRFQIFLDLWVLSSIIAKFTVTSPDRMINSCQFKQRPGLVSLSGRQAPALYLWVLIARHKAGGAAALQRSLNSSSDVRVSTRRPLRADGRSAWGDKRHWTTTRGTSKELQLLHLRVFLLPKPWSNSSHQTSVNWNRLSPHRWHVQNRWWRKVVADWSQGCKTSSVSDEQRQSDCFWNYAKGFCPSGKIWQDHVGHFCFWRSKLVLLFKWFPLDLAQVGSIGVSRWTGPQHFYNTA